MRKHDRGPSDSAIVMALVAVLGLIVLGLVVSGLIYAIHGDGLTIDSNVATLLATLSGGIVGAAAGFVQGKQTPETVETVETVEVGGGYEEPHDSATAAAGYDGYEDVTATESYGVDEGNYDDETDEWVQR